MKALTLPVLIPDREGKVLVFRNILQVPFDRRIFGSIEMKENIVCYGLTLLSANPPKRSNTLNSSPFAYEFFECV